MRAVVLVGGFGTRLRPLTFTRPKQLLPIGHRPMIDVVMGQLARSGITQAVLSLGYKPDAFRSLYPDGTCHGVGLVYAVEDEPLDTAGAIRFAATEAGIDDTFVVVNGDVLTTLDIASLVAFHRSHGAEGTIHLTPVEDPSAFGVVPTAPDGRVEAFIEKPPRHEAPTNLVNGGTYVLEPSVLDRIPAGKPVSIERVTFPEMVADGALYAQATDDYWVDAGKPEPYVQANLDAVEGRGPAAGEPAIGPGAQVAGSVEHSVIGSGAAVAAGATVRRSVLLPGAVVGSGATLTHCVLGEGVTIGEGATLTDCVLGDRVQVEPGAALEGVRLPDPG